ncbi:MAG: hypothetical protein JXA90_04990 [Planctomycetes bacterium]|nr:hypothetical protein [Planctomycetota bacterium]
MSDPRALPGGWKETLYGKADLEASYRELASCEHFFAEGLCGYIRSLQLQFRDAWHHFDRAARMGEAVEDDIPTLIQKFLLEIYRFENALVETPVTLEPSLLETRVPLASAGVFDEYPEVERVIRLRMFCEAKVLLHLGECERAADIYDALIRKGACSTPEQLAGFYLDLAACQQGLGELDLVDRSLENCELAVAAIDGALEAARQSASLYAFYRFLGETAKADGWRGFLLHLRCPSETKALFVGRAQRLLQRCLQHSRLVSF